MITFEGLLVVVMAAAGLIIVFGPIALLCYMDAVNFRFAGRSTFCVPALPVCYGRVFKFAGRKFAMGASDIAAYEFLKHLVATRTESQISGREPRRLICFRSDFRRILGAYTTAGLVRSAMMGSEEEQRIAIWLLGRAHDRSAVNVVNTFASGHSCAIRREATRSLRRLEAWTELRWIAVNDPNETIRRIATPTPCRDFSTRLTQFAGERVYPIVEAPKPEFRLFTVLNSSAEGRPKSRDLIARLLSHIRLLLRGHA